MLHIERKLQPLIGSDASIAVLPGLVTKEIATELSVWYHDRMMIVSAYYMCLRIFTFNKQPIHHRPDGQSKRRGSQGHSQDVQ